MSGTVNARETPTSVRLSLATVETRHIPVFSCSCLYLLLLHHVVPPVVRQWSTTLLYTSQSARYDDKEDGGLLLCILVLRACWGRSSAQPSGCRFHPPSGSLLEWASYNNEVDGGLPFYILVLAWCSPCRALKLPTPPPISELVG
jgi:hypothetical protein